MLSYQRSRLLRLAALAAFFMVVPKILAKPPHHGYCVCGCGVTCTTDADCGPGGRCVAFITCC